MNPTDPPRGLPVCDRCGLLIYPRDSAPHAAGKGCTCPRPKPQPGLLPRPADADQLALFPTLAPPPRKMRVV